VAKERRKFPPLSKGGKISPESKPSPTFEIHKKEMIQKRESGEFGNFEK
jgi:hypothetical protein